jgi:succinoglycan biosynthesis transport protein ExoP
MGNDLIPASDYPMSGPAAGSSVPDSSHRLRRFLAGLKKFWWIPLIVLLVGTGVGYLVIRQMEPAFISQARMRETMKMRLPDQSVYSDGAESRMVGTMIELLQSRKLRDLTLARLKADPGNIEIPLGKDGQPPPVSISVNTSPSSSIYYITATSSNPAFTQHYLDALMQSFINYDRDQRNTISGDTLASITDQMQGLERDLKYEQDALMTFQQTNDMAIVQQEGSIAGGHLGQLQIQLEDLQLEAKLLVAAEKANQSAVKGTNSGVNPFDMIAGVSMGGSSKENQDSKASTIDVELLKLQREELIKATPNSPKIADYDDQIKQAEASAKVNLHQSLSQQAAQLTAYREANQIKMDHANAAIKEWQAKVETANTILGEAERLKLNIQRTQSVYDRLIVMSQNVGISRGLDQESLSILEPASPAWRSYKKEQSGMGFACFAGLALGLGIVFLMCLRDDRFTSMTEVNSALGDSVVGLLPKMNQKKNNLLPLLAPNDERHVYAESYRSLRSALRFLTTNGDNPKVILITSATPNEGKSTVSANLAHTLAAAGSRVLLVDGDLRRGHLHDALGLQNQAGFIELLKGDYQSGQVMQTNSIPNLQFISCGVMDANPGDLLLSSRLGELIDQWRQEFDYVLIDSSPVFAVADAGCIAPKVDGTLFLVRSHFSSARVTREALELLVQRQAKILGVVFNMADTSGRAHHYTHADYYYAAMKPDMKRVG